MVLTVMQRGSRLKTAGYRLKLVEHFLQHFKKFLHNRALLEQCMEFDVYLRAAASKKVKMGIMFWETAAINGDVSWRPARNSC